PYTPYAPRFSSTLYSSLILYPYSPTTISPSIFFYCHGHPRHLHSFPTRRSSDLSTAPISGASGQQAASQTAPTSNRTLTLMQSTDRKSTRLNSSHQIISYAVFCLKKKKNMVLYRTYSTRQLSTRRIHHTARDWHT